MTKRLQFLRRFRASVVLSSNVVVPSEDFRPGESGAEDAALQTLSRNIRRLEMREAFGVRRLQRRFFIRELRLWFWRATPLR